MDAALAPVGRTRGHDVLFDVLDALGDGAAVVAPDGTIEDANVRMAELFGYDPEDLHGRPVEDLVPRHAREAHVHAREALVRTGGTRAMDAAGRDLEGVRRDGERMAVDVQLTPFGDGSTLAVVRDARAAREHVADLALARADADMWRRAADRRAIALDDIVQRVFGVVASLESCTELARGRACDEAAERVERCVAVLMDVLTIAAEHS